MILITVVAHSTSEDDSDGPQGKIFFVVCGLKLPVAGLLSARLFEPLDHIRARPKTMSFLVTNNTFGLQPIKTPVLGRFVRFTTALMAMCGALALCMANMAAPSTAFALSSDSPPSWCTTGSRLQTSLNVSLNNGQWRRRPSYSIVSHDAPIGHGVSPTSCGRRAYAYSDSSEAP